VIQVLQSLQDVEFATQKLRSQELPTHLTVEKNWDQWLLVEHLFNCDRQSAILDLGCGDCCTLDLLAALRFQNLHGIDLTLPHLPSDRPYHLHQGDLTRTPFPDQTFDCAVSISVIEHGVDLIQFFSETYRILQPNGSLFVTTDYWQDKIWIDSTTKPFGLSWNIFSLTEIQTLITLAQQQGFILESHYEIPTCHTRTVSWYGKHYTFIAIKLRKPI
jgi:SAM-dependent methyltransferase